MKFIKLESRGGNYLVVAENVAWLRTAENGQTNVGIVGGQPLLVVGSVEEVAAKILAGAGPEEAKPAAPATAPAPVAAAPAAPPAPAPAPEPVPAPAPVEAAAAQPAPEPAPASVPAPEPIKATPAPKPPVTPAPAPAGEQPKPTMRKGTSLSERIAAAAAPKVKAGTQRYMGASE
jgi:outer membrane biosynthesis protein TonB